MAKRITVNAPNKTYDVIIASGALEQLDDLLNEVGIEPRRTVIGTDDIVARLYANSVHDRLNNLGVAIVPHGEQHKTVSSIQSLYSQFVQVGADRGTVALALGGGVIGDMVGFAAATYMRGIRLVQIPTTLLSMVDSSVGGKVGVDLPEGKNLAGAFIQPEIVIIDPATLSTLPDDQIRCGMAEIIKHGFIADETLLDPAVWDDKADLIARAVQVKVDVVEQDPYEQGIRAHLNLGHTFGHAIELVTDFAWMHGDAVGFGLLAAAHLSHRLGLCSADLVDQTTTILSQLGFPMTLGEVDIDAVLQAMRTDKKWKNGRSRFVLLKGIGQPMIVEDVDMSVVRDVMASLSV